MTVEITKNGDCVEVKYVSDAGSATAVVVGESVSTVKDRSQEIVEAHDLQSKAEGGNQ